MTKKRYGLTFIFDIYDILLIKSDEHSCYEKCCKKQELIPDMYIEGNKIVGTVECVNCGSIVHLEVF